MSQTFALVNLPVTAQLPIVCSNLRIQSVDLSLSHSQLYALNFRSASHPIKMQIFQRHISPSLAAGQQPVFNQTLCPVWMEGFFLKYGAFAFWVLEIWSFSCWPPLTMTHCRVTRPLAAQCIGSSVRCTHGVTHQRLSAAWLPSGK